MSVRDDISNMSNTVKSIGVAVAAVVVISGTAITFDHTYLSRYEFTAYKQTQLLDKLKVTRSLELANILQLQAIPKTQRTLFEKTELAKAINTIAAIDKQRTDILSVLNRKE